MFMIRVAGSLSHPNQGGRVTQTWAKSTHREMQDNACRQVPILLYWAAPRSCITIFQSGWPKTPTFNRCLYRQRRITFVLRASVSPF